MPTATKMAADEVVAAMELALQFVGFKNIDLFSQGIYQLRVSAHGAHSGRQALPFAVLEAPPEANANVPDLVQNKDILLPAHIIENTGEFCSPSFRVRFCEEEVMIRSMVRMRLDLSFLEVDLGGEAVPKTGSGIEHACLTIKLMHARSTTKFEPGNDCECVEEESMRHFTVAASQKVLVSIPLPAVSAFFPITFSDWHFCCELPFHLCFPPLRGAAPTLALAASLFRRCPAARPRVANNVQALPCPAID